MALSMDYWPPPLKLQKRAFFPGKVWHRGGGVPLDSHDDRINFLPKKFHPVVTLAPKPSSRYFQVQEGHGPVRFNTHQGWWMCGSGGNRNNICEKLQNEADLFCCFVRFDISCKIRFMFGFLYGKHINIIIHIVHRERERCNPYQLDFLRL